MNANKFIFCFLDIYRPVLANNLRRRHAVVPTIAFRYGVPLRYRSVKSNVCKPGTTIESAPIDACHTVTDCHARKPGATGEGRRADARHAVRDCNVRKPGATTEGRTTDARHATVCGNNTVFATQYQRFAFRLNKTISCTVIVGVSFINNNARKPGATREGSIADARHAVSNCHARKPGAFTKSVIMDLSYA